MIFIGADHAGLNLKKDVVKYLSRKKIPFQDMGAYTYNKYDDYPDFGFAVAEKVSRGLGEGILACKGAGGMTIVANKVKGVRAVPCSTPEEVLLAREHNHANVLVLGENRIEKRLLSKILDKWFKTRWSRDKRHLRRLRKIAEYEDKKI